MVIKILGTDYQVIKKRYDEDEAFARLSIDGYCDGAQHKIVYCDMSTYKGWEHEEPDTVIIGEKQTLRHEIVHAFFNESGLKHSSFIYDGAWARNEELIDWVALQGPKIYGAWREAGAL